MRVTRAALAGKDPMPTSGGSGYREQGWCWCHSCGKEGRRKRWQYGEQQTLGFYGEQGRGTELLMEGMPLLSKVQEREPRLEV